MNQQTYIKIPFVWEEPKPLIEVPSRLRFESLKAVSNEVLISALACVMDSSIDASDRKDVSKHGSREAAERFLATAAD